MHNYIQKCKQILQAFELSQSAMLQLKTATACREFAAEIDIMEKLFTKIQAEIAAREIDSTINTLLTKQLKRLLIFTKELSGYLDKLAREQQISPGLVIFIFERQYKFKNILKKHLTDFARFSS